MIEYISREEALSEACKGCSIDFPCEPCEPQNCEIKARLEAIPAADVVEVRHGRWIIEDKYTDYRTERCSSCGFVANRSYVQDVWFYCPRCGAKMDGGGNG